MMMKFNDFQQYQVTLFIPYEKYFALIYETKYLLEARLGTDRVFIANKYFYGCNRRSAVSKASTWYNKNLKQLLGNPFGVMFIDDPLNEVVYDDGFVCTDLRNKFLDNLTIQRLLKEADGELGREDRVSSKGQIPASVKRLRKRKKHEVQLAERLVQSPGGTIYYRMVDLPDGGKAKIRKIKLSSKSLDKAKREVTRRGLDRFEKFTNKRDTSLTQMTVPVRAA
jgi:hypothetical protein